MNARSLILLLLLVLSGLAAPTDAIGQGYDNSPDAATGRPPFSSQIGGVIDSINIFNGNLSLDIPLFSIPGRELSSGIRLSYNSQQWEQFYAVTEWITRYTGGWKGWDLIADKTPEFETPEYLGCFLDPQQGLVDVYQQLRIDSVLRRGTLECGTRAGTEGCLDWVPGASESRW